MAETGLPDIQTPQTFLDYYVEVAVASSAMFNSGLVTTNSNISIPESGVTVTGHFWQALSGADEVLADGSSLTPAEVTSEKETAVILFRGKAWRKTDLAELVAGADPWMNLGNRLGIYWGERYDAVALSALKGSIDSNTANVRNDISGGAGAASNIDAESINDTRVLLGDHRLKIVGAVMHSDVANYVQNQNLNDFFIDTSNEVITRLSGNLTIVEDDSLTAASDIYRTFLFAEGAIVFNNGTPADLALEFDRDILAGKDDFATRQRFIMHPFGYNWGGGDIATPAEPTNADLEVSASWSVKAQTKNLRCVELKHKINQS